MFTNLVHSTIPLALLLVACSDTAHHSGGATSSGATAGSECPSNPLFECSQSPADVLPGLGFSVWLDDQGCMVRLCGSDDDCLEGEQCQQPGSDSAADGCLVGNLSCAAADGECRCSGNPSGACVAFCAVHSDVQGGAGAPGATVNSP